MAKAVIVTGIREVDRRLKSLEPKVQKKILRPAMREGLKVLASELKANLSVVTGATKDAVKVRAVKKRKRGSIEFEVRIEGNERTIKQNVGNGKRAFYPAIVEYGDKDNAPQAPMRRAYDNKGEAARQKTIEMILRGIQAIVSAMGRSGRAMARGSAGGGPAATGGKAAARKPDTRRDSKGRFIKAGS